MSETADKVGLIIYYHSEGKDRGICKVRDRGLLVQAARQVLKEREELLALEDDPFTEGVKSGDLQYLSSILESLIPELKEEVRASG